MLSTIRFLFLRTQRRLTRAVGETLLSLSRACLRTGKKLMRVGYQAEMAANEIVENRALALKERN